MGVVRNHTNNELYLYLGNDNYRNLRTGKEGSVNPEVAEKIFKINIEASVICLEYPIVEYLINKLDLKIER